MLIRSRKPMKRCPECRRDYYDDTLSFCLEDGTPLVYGLSSDEPATAILSEPGAIATGFPSQERRTALLHSTAAPGEAPTRAQINTTDRTAIFPAGAEGSLGDPAEKHSLSAHRAAKPLAALTLTVVILVGGFFGYRYFSAANSKQIESIAVMPFVNESGNAEIEYLSDGMTETLISSLTQLPNLNVKARSSVFRYKGKETDAKTLGKELNVQAILNGRVAQRGDQLTLSLELVDVQTENAIWSQQYTRKQADLVSLQSEIARDVSVKLKSKLSGADVAKVEKTYTTNTEAYQLYLKGRFYWNKRDAENTTKAIEQFKAAVAIDPNYALAYAGLADSYVLAPQNIGTPGSEAFPQAKGYAQRALEIDERLAQSHATLGLINHYLWNWTEADKEFKRAIELDPNYPTAHQWYSTLLKNVGRSDEGLAEIKRANELDPLSLIILLNLGLTYLERSDVDTGIAQLKKIYEIDPNFESGHIYLGIGYLKQGRNAEALSEFQTFVDLTKRKHESLAFLGYAQAKVGKRDEALALIKEIKESSAKDQSDSYFIGTIYAGSGDKDEAFVWLEKSFQERSYSMSGFRKDILLEPLRDDPRYAGLLKRMNLPE